MGITEILLLLAGGLLAGFINVMAGGAGFMTFPLLLAAGMTEDADHEFLIAAVCDVLAAVRGAKTEAKVSQRAEVARIEVAATDAQRLAIESAIGDLRSAGSIAEVAFGNSGGERPVTSVVLAPQGGGQ